MCATCMCFIKQCLIRLKISGHPSLLRCVRLFHGQLIMDGQIYANCIFFYAKSAISHKFVIVIIIIIFIRFKLMVLPSAAWLQIMMTGDHRLLHESNLTYIIHARCLSRPTSKPNLGGLQIPFRDSNLWNLILVTYDYRLIAVANCIRNMLIGWTTV